MAANQVNYEMIGYAAFELPRKSDVGAENDVKPESPASKQPSQKKAKSEAEKRRPHL